MPVFEIRKYDDPEYPGSYRVLSDTPFASKEEAERELNQMFLMDWDGIKISEVIPLMIDKQAAAYLIDLLNSHVGGRAVTDTEPLGRVRHALDALRYYGGENVITREYLVSLPTDQKYPNLVRANDYETIARHTDGEDSFFDGR